MIGEMPIIVWGLRKRMFVNVPLKSLKDASEISARQCVDGRLCERKQGNDMCAIPGERFSSKSMLCTGMSGHFPGFERGLYGE